MNGCRNRKPPQLVHLFRQSWRLLVSPGLTGRLRSRRNREALHREYSGTAFPKPHRLDNSARQTAARQTAPIWLSGTKPASLEAAISRMLVRVATKWERLPGAEPSLLSGCILLDDEDEYDRATGDRCGTGVCEVSGTQALSKGGIIGADAAIGGATRPTSMARWTRVVGLLQISLRSVPSRLTCLFRGAVPEASEIRRAACPLWRLY